MRREAEKEKEENGSNAELKASDATGVTEEGERGAGGKWRRGSPYLHSHYLNRGESETTQEKKIAACSQKSE